MTFLKLFFLAFVSLSAGSLASAGVFTVLVSVGLIPRFAGKTHTSKKISLFEEMVVAGTIIGGLVSVFAPFCMIGEKILDAGWIPQQVWQAAGSLMIAIYGIFAGMFVGCLALAIAEMLDSIPILARRIGFRHGIGAAILGMAVGKLLGSLYYFYAGIN